MPTVPSLPPQLMQQQGAGAPASPSDYLMAAAELHSSGQLSAPDPTGHDLQTGKPTGTKARARSGGRDKLQVVK